MARYSLEEMTAITDLLDDVKRIGMQINKRTFILMLHFSCRSMKLSRGRDWSTRRVKTLWKVVKVNRLTQWERVMTGTVKVTTGQEQNGEAKGCLRRHWSRNLRSMIVWTPTASLVGRREQPKEIIKWPNVSILSVCKYVIYVCLSACLSETLYSIRLSKNTTIRDHLVRGDLWRPFTLQWLNSHEEIQQGKPALLLGPYAQRDGWS